MIARVKATLNDIQYAMTVLQKENPKDHLKIIHDTVKNNLSITVNQVGEYRIFIDEQSDGILKFSM